MTFQVSPEARDWVRTIRGSYGSGLRSLLALREHSSFADQDLARIAPTDALTQRRIQESARAAGDRRFTIRDALTESGYRRVHCVSIACILLDALGEVAPQGPYQGFWHRAATRGILALLAASPDHAHRDSAFAAGFTSEIGGLLRDMYEATQPRPTSEAAPEGRRPVAAGGYIASTDLAVALAERWRLPAEIQEAVGGPPVENDKPSIRTLIEMADRAMTQLAAGESASERAEDEAVMQRLEALGGRGWLDRSARTLIEIALVEDRLTAA